MRCNRPIKTKKSEKQKQIEEEEAERAKEQQRQEAERARKEAGNLKMKILHSTKLKYPQ